MTDMTKYPDGTFCWVELSTSSGEGAKRFYTELFGWTTSEVPLGDGTVYVMLQKDGKDVAALYENTRMGNIPPNWLSYVAVSNLDEVTERSKSLGAHVVAGPFDVGESGRMSLLSDPQGAAFALWQAKKHIGAELVNEPGSLCWNELATSDVDAARTFYSSLLGWNIKQNPGYDEIDVNGKPNGGMMQLQAEWGAIPPNWLPYFAVSDTDAIIEKTKAAGGQVRMGPAEAGDIGRFAVLADPQGATFAVIRLNKPPAS